MANRRRKNPSPPSVFKVIRPPKPHVRPMTKAQQLQAKRTAWFLSGRETSFTNAYSVLFDGVDEYGTGSQPDTLDGATQATWSFWIKPVGNALDAYWEWSHATVAASIFIVFYHAASGGVALYTRGGSGDQGITSAAVTLNEWVHVCIVYDGDQAAAADRFTIYLDGVEDPADAGINTVGTLPAGSTTALFGASVPYPANDANGCLDEPAIWGGIAMTGAQVTELYNGGAPFDLATHSVGAPDHWWRMGDGDTFPTLVDIGSIGGADSTLTNMEAGDIQLDVGTT